MNNYTVDYSSVFDEHLAIDPLIDVELQRLKTLLENRYNHVSIVGDNEYDAEANLAAFIQQTSNKFIPMLRMYDNELSDLLQLTETVTKDTTSNRTQSDIETPSTDSTLVKENDTPDAGNIDLTTDNYISNSMRTSVDIGQRERNATESGTGTETLTSIDRLRALETIGNIKELVSDLYGDWIKLIDINCFTYNIE